jgi:hypothetical protein
VSLDLVLHILRVVHIYSAIVLVGSIIFNTTVLMPALRRIPPAHSAVVSQKIGGGLMTLGGSAIVLLGVTGFLRLWLKGTLPYFFSSALKVDPYLHWLALMVGSWLVLAVTGTLSAVWYQTILTQKLPYSAGLRDLEERRAAQARISNWQDRLAYVNLTVALLAALGGAMTGF